MSDVDGSASGENGENAGIFEVSGGTILDLKVDGEDEQRVYQPNGRVIHLRDVER